MCTLSGEDMIDELQTAVYKEDENALSSQTLQHFGFTNLKDEEDSLILFCIYTSILKHQLCGTVPLLNAWKANKLDEFKRGRFTPNFYYIAWVARELHIPRHNGGPVDNSVTLIKYDQCPLCLKEGMLKREVELHGGPMQHCVCETRVCIDCCSLKKCPVCGTARRDEEMTNREDGEGK